MSEMTKRERARYDKMLDERSNQMEEEMGIKVEGESPFNRNMKLMSLYRAYNLKKQGLTMAEFAKKYCI